MRYVIEGQCEKTCILVMYDMIVTMEKGKVSIRIKELPNEFDGKRVRITIEEMKQVECPCVKGYYPRGQGPGICVRCQGEQKLWKPNGVCPICEGNSVGKLLHCPACDNTGKGEVVNMVSDNVCLACDGTGMLSQQWVKEECIKCGGHSIILPPDHPSADQIVYVRPDGSEIAFKTIGGSCTVCKGEKVVINEDPG